MLGKFDRGQLGLKHAQPWIIVETDQPKIIGTLQSHFFGGFEEADCHQVIRDVDSVRPMREQSVTGAESGLDSVIALNHQFLFEAKVFRLERILKSLKARKRVADFQWTADQADPLAASSRKMTDRIVGTLIVVGDDGVFGEPGISTHDEDERDVRVFDHLAEGGAEIFRGLGEQDAVDALREQEFDGALFFIEVVVAVTEQKVVAVFLRGIFGAADHHWEKRIGDVGHDHADGVSALLGQAARDQIGAIFELADRFLNSLTQFLADMTFVVNDGRDGKDGDARFVSDIVDACGLRGFLLPASRLRHENRFRTTQRTAADVSE